MLNEKHIRLDLLQNPGFMIGKDEMAQFLDFVNKLARRKKTQENKTK